MQYILLLILTSWVLTLATFLALKKILIQITATVSHFDENKSFNATSTSCIVQVFKVRGGKKKKKKLLPASHQVWSCVVDKQIRPNKSK